MIKTLWNAQENLSFTQGLVVAGLSQVISSDWGLSDSERTDWADTVARRIRTACRHIMQQKIKKPK
eukprot:13621724-Alexandrium_andersonii.AAC.1